MAAFEMAQQLLGKGERVGFLGILNYEAPSRERWGTKRNAMMGLMRETYYLGGDLLGYARWRRQKRSLELPSRLVRLERLMMRAVGILPPEELTLPGADFSSLPGSWKRVMLNLIRIVRSYEPRPYGGVLTVFRQGLNPIFSSRDPADGWGHLAGGGLIVINAKGRRHVDMLEPPEAETMARVIRRLIDWHEERAGQRIAAGEDAGLGRLSANAFEKEWGKG